MWSCDSGKKLSRFQFYFRIIEHARSGYARLNAFLFEDFLTVIFFFYNESLIYQKNNSASSRKIAQRSKAIAILSVEKNFLTRIQNCLFQAQRAASARPVSVSGLLPATFFSRGHVVQDPRGVLGDPAVDGGRTGAAAVLRSERDDADEVVPRRPVLPALDLHQGPAAVAAAGVLAGHAAHAHLPVPDVRVAPEGALAPIRLDDRQLERLQDRAGLWVA